MGFKEIIRNTLFFVVVIAMVYVLLLAGYVWGC